MTNTGNINYITNTTKKKLTLSIDEDILHNAKKAEINLSAFLETRLVDYLTRKSECSRLDLNPSLRLERP